MDILGKDKTEQAYRVGLELDGRAVEVLVGDGLLSSEHGSDAKVSHGQAYEWIAANQHALTDAVRALVAGKRPRAPFDALTLAEES